MPLLDRQVRLLDYLTSSDAIFGEDENAALDPTLLGMDSRLLRLEARFSHEKRMQKINAVFPKTFRLLGAERDAIVQEFVKTWPPTDITRISNGRQFQEALQARWRRQPPQPRYLPDVVACELAIATARVIRAPPDSAAGAGEPPAGVLRRRPDIILLRCAYDIRPVIEGGGEEAAVAWRDTPLVIAVPLGGEQPVVFEVLPPVYDVLAALDEWTARSTLGASEEIDQLIRELGRYGLVEEHA